MRLLRLVDQPRLRPNRRAGFVLAVLAVFGVVAAFVFAGAKAREADALRAENQKLRQAFAIMRERTTWSCDIAEGERIICAVKEGMLSRLALTESDQLVSARGIASPLGKASKKRKGRAR